MNVLRSLLVGNQLVTDFLVNANLFKDCFSQQCTAVDNGSSIPPNKAFATEQKLSTFEFCIDHIIKIIKSLDPNKAHGHDEMSIRIKNYVLLQSQNLCQFSLETVLKIFP